MEEIETTRRGFVQAMGTVAIFGDDDEDSLLDKIFGDEPQSGDYTFKLGTREEFENTEAEEKTAFRIIPDGPVYRAVEDEDSLIGGEYSWKKVSTTGPNPEYESVTSGSISTDSASTREFNGEVNLNRVVEDGLALDIGDAAAYAISNYETPLKLTVENGQHEFSTQLLIDNDAIVLEGTGGGAAVSGGTIQASTELVWTGDNTTHAVKVQDASGVELRDFGLRPSATGDGARGIDVEGTGIVRGFEIEHVSVSEFGDAGVALSGTVFDYGTNRLSLIQNNQNGGEADYYEHNRTKLNDATHVNPYWNSPDGADKKCARFMSDLVAVEGGHLHGGRPCLELDMQGPITIDGTTIEGRSSSPYSGSGIHATEVSTGVLRVTGDIRKWDTGIEWGVSGENHPVYSLDINARFSNIESNDVGPKQGTGRKKAKINHGYSASAGLGFNRISETDLLDYYPNRAQRGWSSSTQGEFHPVDDWDNSRSRLEITNYDTSETLSAVPHEHSYTGDANSSQSITLNFAPKAVMVTDGSNTVQHFRTNTAFGSHTVALEGSPSGTVTITSTGFDVDGDLNTDGTDYGFIAW